MSKPSSKRIAVVVSQGQSKNPQKRDLEESIITGLMFEAGIDVTVVPHLYDLKPDGTGLLALQGIRGDMIVCSWMFERAAHWILDRNGITGHLGTTLIQHEAEDDLDDEEFEDEEADVKDRVINNREFANRKIFCLDLKVTERAEDYIEEVKRIQAESQVQVVGLGGIGLGSLDNNGSGGSHGNGKSNVAGEAVTAPTSPATIEAEGAVAEGAVAEGAATEGAGESDEDSASVKRVEEKASRRWYPVIDYSRCTNCMECIDFCLFGVYGVDKVETILVEQPDNCRKGCPACSRVCPENAIIFPQHKTPAIAGSDAAVGGLKIDLSKLFGAPDAGKDAIDVAVLERDEQLLIAGRQMVGESVGIPKRQPNDAEREPRDEFDDLLDELDDMDL